MLKSPWVTSALGIVVALAIFECFLRPIASVTPQPYIHRGEFRQYHEGLAISHYSAEGERLTGNQPLPGAATLLLVGDSHIEAEQVADQETMGSVLERRSRAAGKPLRVRQFGLSGTNLSSFLQGAEQLQQETQPDRTVVLLTAFSLGFHSPRTLRLTRSPRPLSYFFEDSPGHPYGSRLGRLRRYLCARSVLTSELWLSSKDLQYSLLSDGKSVASWFQPQADAEPDTNFWEDDPKVIAAAVPKAIRKLRDAYGDKLLLIYDIDLYEISGNPSDPVESSFLRACREMGVACSSTRAALLKDREEHQRFSRGFSNTAPGLAHFNPVGHQIVADVIWEALQPREGR